MGFKHAMMEILSGKGEITKAEQDEKVLVFTILDPSPKINEIVGQ